MKSKKKSEKSRAFGTLDLLFHSSLRPRSEGLCERLSRARRATGRRGTRSFPCPPSGGRACSRGGEWPAAKENEEEREATMPSTMTLHRRLLLPRRTRGAPPRRTLSTPQWHRDIVLEASTTMRRRRTKQRRHRRGTTNEKRRRKHRRASSGAG